MCSILTEDSTVVAAEKQMQAVEYVRVSLPKITKSQKQVLNLNNVLVTSRHQLTLYELRFLLGIGYLVQKNREHSRAIKVSAKDISALLGYKVDGLYTILEPTINRLMESIISIYDGNGGWDKVNFFEKASYKRGDLTLLLSEESQSFFISLTGNYTQLNMLPIIGIRSLHAFRLYMFLKHEYRQNRKRLEISLLDLRKLLCIDDSEYLKYSHFKSRIITPALAEMNAICEIQVSDFKEIKTGKAVASLVFEISKNFAQGVLPEFFMKEDIPIPTVKKLTFPAFVDFLRKESPWKIGSDKILVDVGGVKYKFDAKGKLYRTDSTQIPSVAEAEEIYKKLYDKFKETPQSFGFSYEKVVFDD